MPTFAIILAAGRGERMRPLTDHTPKPLLQVHQKPLLQWHLEALTQAGVQHVIINTAWLGTQISDYFGAHGNTPALQQHTLRLDYSNEELDFGGALETAGGIVRALKLVQAPHDIPQPTFDPIFWLLAGDVYAPDFKFPAHAVAQFKASTQLAHLWLVNNPEHHPTGDFGIDHAGLAWHEPPSTEKWVRYTYSTIGLFRASFFANCGIPLGNPAGIRAPLAPLLRNAMQRGHVSAELYTGRWTDVGTPERLAHLNADDNSPF